MHHMGRVARFLADEGDFGSFESVLVGFVTVGRHCLWLGYPLAVLEKEADAGWGLGAGISVLGHPKLW